MWKNNDGMTLIEVMVSMAIVFIFFLGITASGVLVLDQNVRNDQRDAAVVIAEETMMAMRNLTFENLATITNAPVDVVRKIRGKEKTYSVIRTVTFPSTDLAMLSVTVNWIRLQRVPGGYPISHTYTHSLSTIVRR